MTDSFSSEPNFDERSGRSRIPSIVALMAMLCVGILVGVVLEHSVFHVPWPGHGWPGGSMMARDGRHRGPRPFDDRIARELKLTAAQRARIDSIMAQRIRDIERARQEMRPHMRQIFAQTRAEIDSVLTPAQRERLHAMFPHREGEGQDTNRMSPPPL